jgi:hypothetical protein
MKIVGSRQDVQLNMDLPILSQTEKWPFRKFVLVSLRSKLWHENPLCYSWMIIKLQA